MLQQAVVKDMKLIERIKLEEETQCYMKFKVNEDGTLDYNVKSWKIVEPKLRSGWAQAHVFDIISKVYFSENGWITNVTLEVEKKRPGRILPIKIGDVKVEISGDEVIAELGGVVNKNLIEIIQDVREGYLPRIMEEFDKSEKVQLQVSVAYANLKIKKTQKEYKNALDELKEAQRKLEEYNKNGGI